MRGWLLFLVGPLIWCGYFSVVYLLGEAACSPMIGAPGAREGNAQTLSTFIVVAAAISALLSVVFAGRAYRSWRVALHTTEPDELDQHHREVVAGAGRLESYREFLTSSGALLSVFFALTALTMGLPLLVLRPC